MAKQSLSQANGSMALKEILNKNRDLIVRKWFDRTVDTYPGESQKHIRTQKNPFANPVGGATTEGLTALFDILVQQEEPDEVALFESLDKIIRMRAVQDFVPAQAVGFVFFLKSIVREAVKAQIHQAGMMEELLTFESKIDKLALQSFNIYMQCREKIYDLKANELRNRTSRILQRAAQQWNAGDEGASEP